MEYAWGLADEIATWKRVVDFEGNDTWTNLDFALRAPVGEPRVVAGTTPRRGSRTLRALIERSTKEGSNVKLTRGSMLDNRANLAESFVDSVLETYGGTHLAAQEIEGELLPAIQGALVTPEMIEDARVDVAPIDLVRVVVGVDPSGGGDAQGIIGAGLGADGDVYVLADRTCRLRPAGWGYRVVQLYHLLAADRIVGERNYGGDMVESTVRVADPSVSYKDVTATRGKAIRFEPVAALYEKGRVHHVGHFPELEDEVCCFTADAYEGEESPNRADAEAWAVHELALGKRGLSPADLYGADDDDANDDERSDQNAYLDGSPART